VTPPTQTSKFDGLKQEQDLFKAELGKT